MSFTLLIKNGVISIKGRSVKNKPLVPEFKHVGLSKKKYMKTLLNAYRRIGFTDFDITDLSELSLRQWVDRKYKIPDGYMMKYHRNGGMLRKLTEEDRIRRLFNHGKIDLKSN